MIAVNTAWVPGWRVAIPLVLLAGCAHAYVSDYVPPSDGRARVLWRDGEAVAMLPKTDAACQESAVQAAREPPVPRVCPPQGCGPAWVDSAIFFEVGIPAHVHTAPLYRIADLPPPVHPSGPVPGPRTHRAMPANARGSKTLPSLGSSAAKESRELLAAAAAVAIATLPIVAIALASAHPEDAPKAAGAVDLANAFNDLARAPGTPCALAMEEAAPGPEVQP